jgi:hypothetical protein
MNKKMKDFITPAKFPTVGVGELVYTEFGKGTVIAEFTNGEVCVRLENTGNGVLCLKETVVPALVRIDIQPKYPSRTVVLSA